MNAYGEPMQDTPAAQEKPSGMMNANWVPPTTESQQAPAPKPANASIEGFNYADMTRDAEKTSQLNAGLTNPLKTTEDLLAKSVITQGSMLKTLTAIYDHMVKTASDRANQDKKESQPATEPQRVDSIQARQAAAIAAGSAEDRNLPSSSFGLTKSPIEMRRRI
jgi:Skp family chaperone for outer membrane proteins